MAKKKTKQKVEVMTVETFEKQKFIEPMKLIQLVFDFYTCPLEGSNSASG